MSDIPTTRANALGLGVTHYATGKPCKRGHVDLRYAKDGTCVVCAQEKLRKRYSENPERSRKWSKDHYYRHHELSKSRAREQYNKNLDARRAYNQEWKRNNRARATAMENQRRAQKLNATLPGWEEELLAIYMACPTGKVVDHIVPLQGKFVCGLHVPWNLQYLTPLENSKKGNQFPYTTGSGFK